MHMSDNLCEINMCLNSGTCNCSFIILAGSWSHTSSLICGELKTLSAKDTKSKEKDKHSTSKDQIVGGRGEYTDGIKEDP
jgi:hypothetical protein